MTLKHSRNINRRTIRSRLRVERLESRDVPSLVPLGPEFRVSTSSYSAVHPELAFCPDGGFNAVWNELNADGSSWGVQWAEKTDLPMIVMRPIDRVVPLAEARAACDALQRDLAGKHDAAGFWV